MLRHAQVAIVGAGPAGSSCAARLTAAGIDTLLIDKTSFPRPKPCAGWLTPRVFDLLGVAPEEYPDSLTRFGRLNLRLRGVPLRVPGLQYAIRRVEFDAWLLERAGVPLIVHNVSDTRYEADRFVIDRRFSADVLVGAGGPQCPVYRAFFAASSPRERGSAIVAMEEEFAAEPVDDRCLLWFFDDGLPGYAWYVPKGGTHLNIGIGAVRSSLAGRHDTLRRHWSNFVARLEEEGLVRGHTWRPVGHRYHLRQQHPAVGGGARRLSDGLGRGGAQHPADGLGRGGASYDGRLLLVGDALGLATLDMGEGIAAAIESGQRAAEAIINGTPYRIDGIPSYSLLPRIIRPLHRALTRSPRTP